MGTVFPPVEFHPDYSKQDRKLYTFLIHSAIREFQRSLAQIGFQAFDKHPVTRIEVTPHALAECNCLGLAKTYTDEIKLRLPTGPSALQVSGTSDIITHELGHHIVQEYYGDTGEGNRLGNDLIHWYSNRSGMLYRYTKTFNSIVFVRKYLLPWVRMPFPNLPRLIAEKNAIIQSIIYGTAPRGPHEYWHRA